MRAIYFSTTGPRRAVSFLAKFRSPVSYFTLAICLLAGFTVCALNPAAGWAQGTDTALLRGTVKDPTGAVIPDAAVTATAIATQVQTRAQTDSAGLYIFNYLKPGVYSLKVEKTGFKTWIFPSMELRIGTQSDQDVTLQVGSTQQTVEVTGAAPLLNTVSAALGTTVNNQYLQSLPLLDRNIANLSYLSGGVTQVSGASADMLGGTVFASNGQRYGTAEFRLDGVLATRPEGGEGGNTDVDYMPDVDALQEFRLQNNNMSAEYGNNGGTVVNIVTKSGTNKYHGSGYWFFRRPGLDANDFFTNQGGGTKGQYTHDQYGGSVGGPIKKDKTFFFFDYERFRNNSPRVVNKTVPTMLERQGDFSQTFNDDGSLQQLYNPFQVSCTPLAGGGQDCERQPFNGNMIPSTMFDSIGAQLVNLYPKPTDAGVGPSHLFNFSDKLIETNPSWQMDLRIDQDFSAANRLTARYSMSHASDNVPDDFLTPVVSKSITHNVALEDTWTVSPTLLWVNRVGVNRDNYPEQALVTVDPLKIGFPESMINNVWYREVHFPTIQLDNYATLASNNGCCTDTVEGDTQWMFDSTVTKIYGNHSFKFGGEERIFLNNFFQPDTTSGSFSFGQAQTMQSVFSPDFSQGNSVASLLLGFMNGGGFALRPHVANKSSQGAAFVLDDWKVTSRLTISAGLRWEWTVPYSERYNHNMFTCFDCPSGITVPGVGPLKGTTILAGPNKRHANSSLTDIGPRLSFAYRLTGNTVVHSGAGIYHGMSFATNWQYGGYAWQSFASVPASLDGGITQRATMANPFPLGFNLPQQGKYGPLSLWGYGDENHGSDTFRTGEIFQWNIGIQHQWGSMMLEADYVGNRSTHLPWNYSTENRNFINAANRVQYGTAGLANLVPNPFQYLFKGNQAIFNAPGSIYSDDTIPQINLLRPFPQFDGVFTGFPLFVANSSYHAFQLRFEKRAAHGLSFVGNYTFSKFIDDSDAGGNAWIGGGGGAGIGFIGSPQDFTNLALEKSVSANDTPQRLTFAVVYDLPVGRGQRFGSNMNKVLNGAVGGWRLTPFVTFQTGQPISVNDANQLLADGNQRPNLIGNPCTGASLDDIANGTASYFNNSAFSHPADQTPGTTPRYFSNCRVPGITNLDLSIAKQYHFRENMFIEVRGDFFNALNTPRFGAPQANSADGTGFGNNGFGAISYQENQPRHGQIGIHFVF
ncbi:MAG TPA: carboxypeptidase-like regulatory domain-containing protein [Terriglobia bacterium]|nr:carboxypeptidase-like regulatory domain-containing protein [Terriglobia bacterium]